MSNVCAGAYDVYSPRKCFVTLCEEATRKFFRNEPRTAVALAPAHAQLGTAHLVTLSLVAGSTVCLCSRSRFRMV